MGSLQQVATPKLLSFLCIMLRHFTLPCVALVCFYLYSTVLFKCVSSGTRSDVQSGPQVPGEEEFRGRHEDRDGYEDVCHPKNGHTLNMGQPAEHLSGQEKELTVAAHR